ncbi:MAG: type II secretion system protein [Phycisphaerae bacterium]|nr:type II secretion system protein [Phycisphaerae bacterium]
MHTRRFTEMASSRLAMTLIEMTITIFLVSVMLFLLTGWMTMLRTRSKESLAIRMLADLDNALARYRRAEGQYPTYRGPDSAIPVVVDLLDHERTRSTIQAFPASLWRGPDLQRCLVDPWGTPLRYLPADSENPAVRANAGRPIFISAGPDRDFGDDDPAARGDNLRSDDPGPDGFRLHEAIREALDENLPTPLPPIPQSPTPQSMPTGAADGDEPADE